MSTSVKSEPGMAWQHSYEDLLAVQEAALAAFLLPGSKARLLQHSENAIFNVVAGDGNEYLLRIHGYQSAAKVTSECKFLDYLGNERGMAVPRPASGNRSVLDINDTKLEKTFCCSLLLWNDGGPGVEDPPTPASFERLGRILGQLHNSAERWKRPTGFSRPLWDWKGLLGPAFAFEKTADAYWYNRLDLFQNTLHDAVDLARPFFERLGRSPSAFGIIHGDFNFDNTLIASGQLRLLDFDDCGPGFWVYDIASALQPWDQHQAFPSFLERLLIGYESSRALPIGIEFLTEFIAIRHMALLRWAISRSSCIERLRDSIPRRLETTVQAINVSALSRQIA